MFTSSLEDMIKDTNQQVSNKGVSVFLELGAQFGGMWKCSASPTMEALRKSYIISFRPVF